MEKESAEKLLYKTEKASYMIDLNEMETYCNEYRDYMDHSKIEREAVKNAVALAESAGFVPYIPGKPIHPGMKLYRINRLKSLMLCVVGNEPISNGFRIIASHIDSPRLDLKPLPIYEAGGLGYFKTHYYGGIKKYQWSAIPLALHGIIYRKDGSSVSVSIGEDENDPILYISDLMPHIAKDQMSRASSDILPGESLNPIIGSEPFDKDGDVKLNILRILNEKYGIDEADFLTAELHVVPAQKSRIVGFDESLIAAYGQDDKVCAYASLKALLALKEAKHTTVVFLADKEEIGSEGVTGLRSEVYAAFLKDLCCDANANEREAFRNSLCISADVGGAYDSNFADAYEAKNSCYLGNGITISKYTGSRGKSGCSDASAELMYQVIKLMKENNIPWQTGEYGKVDQGGAGTVAVDIAKIGIDVIDVGVPILSMHSPVELAAKSDVYAMYLFSKFFFQS